MAPRHERDEDVIALFMKALRGEMTPRDLAMVGFGPETRRIITNMIALNPAWEMVILDLAEAAYMDGLDARGS